MSEKHLLDAGGRAIATQSRDYSYTEKGEFFKMFVFTSRVY